MASNRRYEGDNGYKYRPVSNLGVYTPFGRGSNRGRGSSHRNPSDRCNFGDTRAPNFMPWNSTSQRAQDGETPFYQKTVDDETRDYAVVLHLKPVETGIATRTPQGEKVFNGLGAFSRYFQFLSPDDNFSPSLPDIWDGYFHITLALFKSPLTPEALEERFRHFRGSSEPIPHISGINFQASRIETKSGTNRSRGRDKIDFIVLPIDCSSEVQSFYRDVQPLLDEIQWQSETDDWRPRAVETLHVTLRKYSKIPNGYTLGQIPIAQFPLHFRCSHLEVRQPREQAIGRRRRRPTYQWWSGVTEINQRCSGCQAPITSRNWEGCCSTCGEYETIRPLWLTFGENRDPHNTRQDTLESSTLTELVQHVRLSDQ